MRPAWSPQCSWWSLVIPAQLMKPGHPSTVDEAWSTQCSWWSLVTPAQLIKSGHPSAADELVWSPQHSWWSLVSMHSTVDKACYWPKYVLGSEWSLHCLLTISMVWHALNWRFSVDPRVFQKFSRWKDFASSLHSTSLISSCSHIPWLVPNTCGFVWHQI